MLIGGCLSAFSPGNFVRHDSHDVPGFIKKMSPVYYICGTLFLLLGAASLYMDYTGITNSTVGLAITAILLATCVVFAWQTKAAQDKFLK